MDHSGCDVQCEMCSAPMSIPSQFVGDYTTDRINIKIIDDGDGQGWIQAAVTVSEEVGDLTMILGQKNVQFSSEESP